MRDLWVSWLILTIICAAGMIKLLSIAPSNKSSYYMSCKFNAELDKKQLKKGKRKWWQNFI